MLNHPIAELVLGSKILMLQSCVTLAFYNSLYEKTLQSIPYLGSILITCSISGPKEFPENKHKIQLSLLTKITT